MRQLQKWSRLQKWRRPQKKDDIKNEDNVKNEDNLILKTVPSPSLHNLRCVCFTLSESKLFIDLNPHYLFLVQGFDHHLHLCRKLSTLTLVENYVVLSWRKCFLFSCHTLWVTLNNNYLSPFKFSFKSLCILDHTGI